jgi:hypothetical protein
MHFTDPATNAHFYQGTRSTTKKKTLNPEWNEVLLFPGITTNMELRLTLADWDRFSKNDFLGQSPAIPVPLFTACDPVGTQREVTVALGPLEVALDSDVRKQKSSGKSPKKKAVKMADTHIPGQGTVTIAFMKVAHLNDTHFGYIHKLTEGRMLGRNVYQEHWCMLSGTEFVRYHSRHDIHPKSLNVKWGHGVEGVAVGALKAPSKGKPVVYPFEIDVGKKKPLKFMVPTEAERDEWIRRLEFARRDEGKGVVSMGSNGGRYVVQYFCLYSVYVQCESFAKLTFYYYVYRRKQCRHVWLGTDSAGRRAARYERRYERERDERGVGES